MNNPLLSDYKGLIALPWTGGFAYHQFDVYFTDSGVQHVMHFFFEPENLILKYLYKDNNEVVSKVETINPFQFENFDFAPYKSCKDYPWKTNDDLSKIIKPKN